MKTKLFEVSILVRVNADTEDGLMMCAKRIKDEMAIEVSGAHCDFGGYDIKSLDRGRKILVPPLAPITDEIGCGLWPTPGKSDGMRLRFLPAAILKAKISHEKRGVQFGRYLARTLAEEFGASQTPTLTERLMMLPIGWTALKELGTRKFHSAWLTPFQNYLKELLSL